MRVFATDYRIPALAVTDNDMVVAVCDERTGTGQNLPKNIDLVMPRSMTVCVRFDEGDTWPVQRVLHAGPAVYLRIAVLLDGGIEIYYECGNETRHDRVTYAECPLQSLND